MNRIPRFEQAVFSHTGSNPDTNKLYSILLDARASSLSENMYDIAERLLKNEKESAKIALEQLWELKKNLSQEYENSTIDLLITFYQDKLDVLRTKEEYIKKISKDSRELLEDKRKRDTEIATVKQEISDCSAEIDKLSKKLNELKIKEQELSLIEEQVKKELQVNTNEVVNGLYEIILTNKDNFHSADTEKHPDTLTTHSTPAAKESSPVSAEKEPFSGSNKQQPMQKNEKKETSKICTTFPKSIVKTTHGYIIGEYYFNPTVGKDKRHYVLNSDFFRKNLFTTVEKLQKKFDRTMYQISIQMIQDAYKRINQSQNLHFEIATNEILNAGTLKELWYWMKQKEYRNVEEFCNRLHAKITALGNNYRVLLEEQMVTYS